MRNKLSVLALSTVLALAIGSADARERTRQRPAPPQPVNLAPAPVENLRENVSVGKATVVRTARPFSEIVLPRPEVANVQVLTDRTFYVYGKEVGATTILLLDGRRQVVGNVDLLIGFDVEGLKGALRQALPNETVEILGTPTGLVLRGTVSSAPVAAEIAAIAERYAPGAVTNTLGVRGPQQVLLEVRFLEASRSVGRELGIDTVYTDLSKVLFSSGSGATDFFASVTSTDQGVTGGVTARTALGDALASGNRAVGRAAVRTGRLYAELDSLEESGVIRTLARPNIAALSGDSASFLAGGEFPIPVASDRDRITVEFKQYGVALSFTPTVLASGRINLKIESEVSALDSNGSIRINQIVLPGLSVRRAATTVELETGQAMAMAGLLQSNYFNQKTQVPWAGDIPVLGTLFRSTRFQRGDTELVVVIVPRLVGAVDDVSQIRNPLDQRVEPNDVDLFLNGVIDKPAPGTPAAPAAEPAKPAAETPAAPRASLDAPSTPAMLALDAEVRVSLATPFISASYLEAPQAGAPQSVVASKTNDPFRGFFDWIAGPRRTSHEMQRRREI